MSKLEEQKLFLQNKNFSALRTTEVKRAVEAIKKMQQKGRLND